MLYALVKCHTQYCKISTVGPKKVVWIVSRQGPSTGASHRRYT